eukprot:jgi/Psemu1/44400/gm1.44400_g
MTNIPRRHHSYHVHPSYRWMSNEELPGIPIARRTTRSTLSLGHGSIHDKVSTSIPGRQLGQATKRYNDGQQGQSA